MIGEEIVGPVENQEPGIEMKQGMQRRVEHCVWFQNCEEQPLWGTVGED